MTRCLFVCFTNSTELRALVTIRPVFNQAVRSQPALRAPLAHERLVLI